MFRSSEKPESLELGGREWKSEEIPTIGKIVFLNYALTISFMDTYLVMPRDGSGRLEVEVSEHKNPATAICMAIYKLKTGRDYE